MNKMYNYCLLDQVLLCANICSNFHISFLFFLSWLGNCNNAFWSTIYLFCSITNFTYLFPSVRWTDLSDSLKMNYNVAEEIGYDAVWSLSDPV